MEVSKFNHTYIFKGFAISCDGSNHEWNVEPITDNHDYINEFKYHVPLLINLNQTKKWINENGITLYSNIKKGDNENGNATNR